MFTSMRNPYLDQWNLLFDKPTLGWFSFKIKLGLEVYPCYACRSIFGSRNSFLDHVNRRGMVLKYKCRDCKGSTIYEFYNPCAFLLHTRQHYNLTEGRINLDNLEISTLPFGLGGFLPDSTIPMLYNVQDDNEGELTFINAKFYNPVTGSKGKSVVTLASEELIFLIPASQTAPQMCLILKQLSSNIPRCKFVSLEERLLTSIPQSVDVNGTEVASNENVEPQQSYDFDLPLITKTETIEDSDDESNLVLNDPLDQFPQCPECKESQVMPMKEHFLKNENLFEDHLKCAMCKYFAPTKCSLQAHERIHDSEAPFVCPECGKDFETSELLHSHLGDVCFHLTKQVRHRCPGKKCGKIFTQLGTYASHFMVHFKNLTACLICERAYFDSAEEFLNHCKEHDSKRYLGKNVYMCTVCSSNDVLDEDDYQQHIAWHAADKKQFLYVYACKHCHSYFRSTATYAIHLLRCTKLICANAETQKKKRKPDHVTSLGCLCKSTRTQSSYSKTTDSTCNNCGEKLILRNPATNNDSEIILKVEPCIDQPEYVTCLLCNKKLHIEVVGNHFNYNVCKYNDPKVLLNAELNHSDIVSLSLGNKKRKKSLSSKSSSISESDTSNHFEEPVPFKGTYMCKLCNFKQCDRKLFHNHIMKHRDVSTAYQCMECGECFVVKPSLVKHLLFYHEISNVEDYFNENECFDKKALKELELNMRLVPGESKEPVAENQCRVCRLQCGDSLELNKHFRVHGMAFLLKNIK